MKRFCSQFTFCSPEKVLRQAVVEQNKFGVITDLFLLNECHSESTHTLFVDGIISSGIISLKRRLAPEKLLSIQADYCYIDLSNGLLPDKIIPDGKKLIFDFGTDSIIEINEILCSSFLFLSSFSIFDVLASCVYYPALALQCDAELAQGVKTNLLQWKGVNLINKRITDKTKIIRLDD